MRAPAIAANVGVMVAAILAAVGPVIGLVLGTNGCASWPEPPGAAATTAARARDGADPDDRDLAALVPPGAETVIEVDLAALRRSPFTAEALQNPDARLRDRTAAALGTDAATDADRIVYATGGAGADAPTLVIAQGRFQVANVEAAFRERWPGATTDAWRGIPVLANGENAFAPLTARTFVSGPPGQVRGAIDRALGVGPDFRNAPATEGSPRGMTEGNPRGTTEGNPRGTTGIGPGGGQGAVRRDLLGFTGAPAPAVLATMGLDEKVRARVGDAFPLPRELRTLGLRLDAGESLDLRVLALLDNREAAANLARRLAALLGDRDTRRAAGAFGLAALVEGVKVAAEGSRVRLTTSVGPDQRDATAAALRAIVRALRTGGDPRAGGSW